MMRLLTGAALLAFPAVVQAQAYKCSVPGSIERPRPDLPDAEQPKRVLPIGGYTLAITWAPQYCRDKGDRAGSRFQCAAGNRFGFTLHGLWPDGVGKEWPQYCRSTTLLSQQVVRRNICTTPSAQLLQHEWSKHGTCMAGYGPERYFGQSTAMFAKLRYPDMDALSRESLTAGRFADAIARTNPGLSADMMRVTANRQGWLDEVWICLDRRFRYARCPSHQGGLPDRAALKIWRGGR